MRGVIADSARFSGCTERRTERMEVAALEIGRKVMRREKQRGYYNIGGRAVVNEERADEPTSAGSND